MKFDHKFWLGGVPLPSPVNLRDDLGRSLVTGRYNSDNLKDSPHAAFYYRTDWATYDDLSNLLKLRFGNFFSNFGSKSWKDTYTDCVVLCYSTFDKNGIACYLLADNQHTEFEFLKPLFDKCRVDHRGNNLVANLFGDTDFGTHKRTPVPENLFKR